MERRGVYGASRWRRVELSIPQRLTGATPSRLRDGAKLGSVHLLLAREDPPEHSGHSSRQPSINVRSRQRQRVLFGIRNDGQRMERLIVRLKRCHFLELNRSPGERLTQMRKSCREQLRLIQTIAAVSDEQVRFEQFEEILEVRVPGRFALGRTVTMRL